MNDPARPEDSPSSPPHDPARTATTVLAWIAGASLGLLVSIGLRVWLGESYPTWLGNALGVVFGAFAGMAAADRIGPRALKPLAFLTGVLVLVAALIALTLGQRPADAPLEDELEEAGSEQAEVAPEAPETPSEAPTDTP